MGQALKTSIKARHISCWMVVTHNSFISNDFFSFHPPHTHTHNWMSGWFSIYFERTKSQRWGMEEEVVVLQEGQSILRQWRDIWLAYWLINEWRAKLTCKSQSVHVRLGCEKLVSGQIWSALGGWKLRWAS